ncbi:ribonuclease J [Sporosarcina sp. P12(2017)]|uniref:ribonuclease J n=1 Tax=unclassified Sporosarcina TaxID=2647733 RepID=UPI000C172495|nr:MULTISPECIES: ribonuclease J [unclassified Sporosarcina]PIC56497.1 ribonuclease J [Sporosarcina sp. P10]PIC60147.1 ribonuclease J [Sporosarcina sp. P12(2017)]
MNIAENTLSIFALGGINEIGKNMYVLQYEDDIIIIDCGAKFPDETLLGVDLIIQDISYLQNNKDKIRALIVTHGHEDHIGGIPYLLKQLSIPIYATNLTLGLIKLKLKEHGLLRATELKTINADSNVEAGTLNMTFFTVNHSIPDCLGIAIHTPVGTVVHTGDFKFDLTPINEKYTDFHKMTEIGNRGVLLLLSESTNAERPGFTQSERVVGEHIEDAFRKANQKIFISTFASNVYRVQQIINAALKTNRKVALLGRSMVNIVSVAAELGYLTIPDGTLIEANEINRMAPDEIVIICTGSQGEPMAALSRLSTSTYRQVSVLAGDTVILASSPIPGNEKSVSRIIDNLFHLGAKVIYGSGSTSGMHVSGHAFQEELKLMLTLMKPTYFIPIHGEFRMLQQHRTLAESVGVKSENIFIINNGDVVDINNTAASQTRRIQAGNVFVDGLGVGDVGKIVLRDRKLLSEEGMLIVVISLSKTDWQIISNPDIISRGFVYERAAEDILNEVNQLVITIVNESRQSNGDKRNDLKHNLKKSIENLLYTQTKRRPMILPFIIEI